MCLLLHLVFSEAPNGLRYRQVGGTRQRYFDGINFKPHKVPENAQTPTSRVHAVLGSDLLILPIAEFYVLLRIVS